MITFPLTNVIGLEYDFYSIKKKNGRTRRAEETFCDKMNKK
jgi:hypothetical protein